MIEKISCMGIVAAKDGETFSVVLLDNEGEWVFPKGHQKPEENLVDTACREVAEETGIYITAEQCIGEIDRFSFFYEGENALKVIHVFLFLINEKPHVRYNPNEGFHAGVWVKVEEALKRLTHDDARGALAKAMNRLTGVS